MDFDFLGDLYARAEKDGYQVKSCSVEEDPETGDSSVTVIYILPKNQKEKVVYI